MYVNQITNFNAIYYCLDYLFIIVITVITINKILDKTSNELTCLQLSYRFFQINKVSDVGKHKSGDNSCWMLI